MSIFEIMDAKDKGLVFFKGSIVAIPSYLMAYLSQSITLVVPTIALCLLLANSIERGSNSSRNRLDDETSGDNEAATDSETIGSDVGSF